MEVHEATEMYMKTILVLKKRLGTVRSIDVANEMGYSKPTISIAMKKFCQEGLITVDESNCIHLTEAGQTIAERIYERHQVLSYILESMGVSEKHALDVHAKSGNHHRAASARRKGRQNRHPHLQWIQGSA